MKPGDMVLRARKYQRTIVYKDERTDTFRGYFDDDQIALVIESAVVGHRDIEVLRVLTSSGMSGWVYAYEVEVVE